MEWIKGNPTEDGRYLVCELREFRERKWLEIKILTWNNHYNVWDDEEGDDFYCEPDHVYCWMPLPDKPEIG